MSEHQHTSGRKMTSSFIDDDNPNSIKLVQLTPRYNTCGAEQPEDPYAVGSFVSNSNLIGDSVFIQEERSRVVSVSKTGERRLLQPNEDLDVSPRSEQFSRTSAKGDGPRICEQSLSQQRFAKSSASICNENSKNSRKKSKATRRHFSQRTRLPFTPRRTWSSHSMHGQLKSLSTNAVQTQTNLQMGVYPTRQIKSVNTKNLQQNFSIPNISSYSPSTIQQRNSNSSSMAQCSQPFNQFQMPIPAKLYKKSSSFIENYAELCSIVSFLTLVTVLSWLISTYFEFKSVSELFTNALQGVRNWFLEKEKPKTKMEILMEALKELYTN